MFVPKWPILQQPALSSYNTEENLKPILLQSASLAFYSKSPAQPREPPVVGQVLESTLVRKECSVGSPKETGGKAESFLLISTISN